MLPFKPFPVSHSAGIRSERLKSSIVFFFLLRNRTGARPLRSVAPNHFPDSANISSVNVNSSAPTNSVTRIYDAKDSKILTEQFCLLTPCFPRHR